MTANVRLQDHQLPVEMEAAIRDAIVACEPPAAAQPPVSAAVIAAFQQLLHVWQVSDMDADGAAGDDGAGNEHGVDAATARAQQVGCSS